MKAGRAVATIAGLIAVLAAAPAAAKTYKVTQTGDPAPAACNARCTLREAVIAANAHSGADKVVLAKKTYKLSRIGEEDLADSGDLDVTDSLSIVGRGPRDSAIAGAVPRDSADGMVTVLGDADLSLKKLEMTGAQGLDEGTALWFQSTGRLRVSNAAFIANKSAYSAVQNEGPDAVFSRVVFRRNKASGCCPALYNSGEFAEIKLTDVVFDRNKAVDDTGAFYSDGAVAKLNRVTFSRNVAGDIGGGAMIPSGGVNQLNNVTFSGNRAKGSGGALYVEEETELNNVTFFDNVADSDNSGGGDGGGIFISDGNTSLSNTILAGNTDRSGEADEFCTEGDALLSQGHNLFGSGTTCPFVLSTSDIALDSGGPGLEPLAANGGFAPSHALRKTSRAVNKGSGQTPGSGADSCEKRDQRGVKRPQGNRCDIGAYELKR